MQFRLDTKKKLNPTSKQSDKAFCPLNAGSSMKFLSEINIYYSCASYMQCALCNCSGS